MPGRLPSPNYKNIYHFFYVFIGTVALLVWINASLSGKLNESALITNAVQWQSRAKGVAVVPVALEKDFKFALPPELSRKIELAVLGSSTVMSISSDHFQVPMYNFSISSNALHASVGQAQYLVKLYPNIRTVLIGYDWALGYPFTPAEVVWPEGSHQSSDGSYTTYVSGLRKSFSTTQALFMASQLRASLLNDAGLSFVGQLFGRDTVETRCPTGERLAYFGNSWPGCGGFFPDGSVRFETFKRPLDAQAGLRVLQRGINGYGAALRLTNGEPNRDYLGYLARLSTTLKARGGRLVLVLPPLLPGLESGLATGSDGASLAKLKSALSSWAQANDLDIIDGGRSEDAGCDVNEFVDGHHALASCYTKILPRTLTRFVSRDP